MDEIEKRIIQNEKDIALVAQRIDLHERECMEKHEAVLNQMKATHKKLDSFISGHTRWMLGILSSIILGLLAILLK